MNFYEQTLDNGLRVFGESSQTMKSVTMGFFVKTGSRDEIPEINGVSHFLEHMCFKGSDRRSADEIKLDFDKMGAQYNAFTSNENTVYYLQVLPEFLEPALNLLSDMMRPAVRKEDFDLEKKVILEEIARSEDMPAFLAYKKAMQFYFETHALGHLVLGTTDSIQKLTHEQMRDYVQKRYAPENMLLGCTGNFCWKEFLRLTEKFCADWESYSVEPRRLASVEPRETRQTFHKTQAHREQIVLIGPAPSRQSSEREAVDLLSVILGASTNSRLYWALIDKGLADDAGCEYMAFDRAGIFYTQVSCDPERTQKVLEITQDVLRKTYREGFSAEEIEAAKNKLLTGIVVGSEQSISRLFPLGMDRLYDLPYRTLAEEVRLIEQLTSQELLALRDVCPLDRFTTVVLGPLERLN
ncbi:insulinase family protein [Candidatus Acetothermia bacterium]|nr:insulinase family protein [Candidatus Acetothermia bacterium]